jgi:ribosomal protein S1
MKEDERKSDTGTVIYKAAFGVIVRLHRLRKTGVVHVADMRGNRHWLRSRRLDSLMVGDEMVVDVIDMGDKRSKGRVRASEKSVHDDIVMHSMPLNEPVKGVIARIESFGAFVELPDWWTTALLPMSKMPGETKSERQKYKDALEIGSEITLFVVEIERDMDCSRVTVSTCQSPPGNVLIIES